jgi:large subunit ribosomal protein L9
MQVILLERIGRLGQMGDLVTVKDGFARNFLLPQGKALRATKTNKARFESERAQLEARNLEQKSEATKVGEGLAGKSFVVVRQAGETGHLYGSVGNRDVAEAVSAGGFSVDRRQVLLDRPIKMLGLHEVPIRLHPEVDVLVTVNVARSADEAERQAEGEDLTGGPMSEREEEEAERRQAKREAESYFEEGAEPGEEEDSETEPEADEAAQ